MNLRVIGIILIVLALLLSIRTSRSKKLIAINDKCNAFIKYVKDNDKGKELSRIYKTPFKIEALNQWYEYIGVTLDGGKEVAVCTEGELNDMMHVVIHELAHVQRNDIEHDDKFWNVQAKLQQYAIEGGFYSPITGTKKFCGKTIGDR